MGRHYEPTRESVENVVFLFIVTVFALLLRVTLFPFESWDYHQFLQGWYTQLKQNGGFAAVGMNIGNYMPTYLYLLAPFTYFPISGLAAIKLVSTVADVVLAAYVMRIVDLKYGPFVGFFAYAAVLFLPGVLLNSAVWGQCDSIYTAALAAFLYYVMTDHENRAVIAFAVAFVFKLQAVFLAPLLLLLLLKRKIRPGALLFLPLVYLLSVFPAILAGRGPKDLLKVYLAQSKLYPRLVMSLPNLYAWIPDKGDGDGSQIPVYFGTAGVLFAGAVVLIVLFYLFRKDFPLDNDRLVALALFFALLLPFVLPHMHERYFYPAEVLSVVFAFYFPKKLYAALAVGMASAYAQCQYLFGTNFISMGLLSVVVLAALVVLARHTAWLTRSVSLLQEEGEAA